MIKWGRTLQTQLIFHRIGFVFFFTVRDRFFWGPDLELFAADIVYLSFNNFNQLFGSSWRNCVRSPAFHKLFQFRIADGPWDWFTIICAEHWELGESSLYGTCPNQNQQLRFQAEIQVNQKGGRFKSWGPAMCHRRVRCLDRRFSLSLRYPSLTMGSRILNIKELACLTFFFCYLSLDNRFAPGLSFVTYVGNKEERPKLQQNLKEQSHFHALLTTYEVHGVFVIWKESLDFSLPFPFHCTAQLLFSVLISDLPQWFSTL